MKFINHAVVAVLTCLALIPPALAQAESANAIEAINVAQQGNDIAVKIDLKEALATPPASFSVATPARVALDFPLTTNGLGKNSLAINQGDLRGLNVVQTEGRTRLVLNLLRSMNYTTRIDGKALYVTLSPIARVGDSPAQQVTRFSEPSLIGSQHSLRDVMFRRGKDGEGGLLLILATQGSVLTSGNRETVLSLIS